VLVFKVDCYSGLAGSLDLYNLDDVVWEDAFDPAAADDVF
jgi:hypothetical protein